MPGVEIHSVKQTALLWTKGATVDDWGVMSVESAIAIPVRWLNTTQDSLDPQGNRVTVDATAVVDRDIAEGSLMWLGSFDDLPGTASVPETGLMEVVKFEKTPDLKGRKFYRSVSLKRHSNTLPPLEE
jgi:hypothetical protein